MTLRAIVVGSGWGAHAADVFHADPRVQLVAVVGRASPRTRDLARRLDVVEYDELERCVGECSPEIAAVAVGEGLHPEMMRMLLNADCHVLCAHPVAPDAQTVVDLAALAERRQLQAATDYSLRFTPGFAAARAMLDELGPPLRIAGEAPGRALVMAVDLCRVLAGPIDAVFASERYPSNLMGRRASTPKAFPPTVLLEHSAGCVSTLVPVPHADPRSAHRITISTERGRLDVALPCGATELSVYRGKGSVRRERLVEERDSDDPVQLFGEPMRRLVSSFVESVVSGVATQVTLLEEAHLRAVWNGLGQSARIGKPVAVPIV